MNPELERVHENSVGSSPWHRWGPYLSERQWGTVREDYSEGGTAWDYFTHDQARSRAYRWGEDGLLGISDRHQMLCFGLALWNGADPILKERCFGLTNSEGNHGEDVKEYYFYLDATPSHSYQKGLYKYPQAAFPYEELIRVNRDRGKEEREYELIDTGIFDEDRYFDVFAEYAKADPNDIWIRITIVNRGPDSAKLTVLPQLWFRNRWSWEPNDNKPSLKSTKKGISIDHNRYGPMYLAYEGKPDLLFTENDTNEEKVFGSPNPQPYVKDAFHELIVNGHAAAVNPAKKGTKAGLRYDLELKAGETQTIHLRLTTDAAASVTPEDCDEIIELRLKEADAYYEALSPKLPADEAAIQRQAFAGLLWSKQFYHYCVRQWLDGDPLQPKPPAARHNGRNHQWRHFQAAEVISMPDAWEYPWFAAWDLAFHTIPFALIDPHFAKNQLLLLLREWYTHPNGQIPAYEWAFGDVNPPVHAWAAWRVYTIERRATGAGDRAFLEKIFHKLLINFTWWVNQKDPQGNNVFQGGFLGLDNIGVFDRSAPLRDGTSIEQSDGTSWMAMYCLNMLTIALELAREEPAYEDVASKFLEHFLYIADAMNNIGEDGIELWDESDGFYYDVLLREGQAVPMRVRSMVGLIPLLAVTNLDPDVEDRFPGFWSRMEWFMRNRPEMTGNVASVLEPGVGERRVLALVTKDRLVRILHRMLDESEFLSPYGIRALSRFHRDHPYEMQLDGHVWSIDYEPSESTTGSFGGNSNWRGPIWFPPNYLLVEALQRMDFYYGSEFKVEMPTGSGNEMSLSEVAAELEKRLLGLFKAGPEGRPCLRSGHQKQDWEQYLLFHEYFDGDTGRGLGASHQTGWTALIAKIVQQLYVTSPAIGETRC